MEKFDFNKLPKKTQNSTKRRYAMMLQIKSDSLRGIVRKGADYARESGCSCISAKEVQDIARMSTITLEDAYNHLQKTNAVAYEAMTRKRAEMAALRDEAETHKAKALAHAEEYRRLMHIINPEEDIQLTLDF